MTNKEIVKIFKAIGNERRLDILKRIAKTRQLSVGQLSEMMDLSFRSVSKHLAVLAAAGLVEAKQMGISRLYSISPDFPRHLVDFIK